KIDNGLLQLDSQTVLSTALHLGGLDSFVFINGENILELLLNHELDELTASVAGQECGESEDPAEQHLFLISFRRHHNLRRADTLHLIFRKPTGSGGTETPRFLKYFRKWQSHCTPRNRWENQVEKKVR
ncbi:MAG TPA: hypothetical protein VLR45_00850, partial [Desulfoprunum sp.]|nr:hypothetical protein [Desulfoprunum sp.]